MARKDRNLPTPPGRLRRVGQSDLLLARVRERMGLSRRALSKLSGLLPGHVAKIESGVLSPRPETLSKIARALKWSDEKKDELLESVPINDDEKTGGGRR